jgi:3-hydroxyacyl-CoA dehydrogenase
MQYAVCFKIESETMQDSPSSYYELRLTRAIEEINHRIKELTDEQIALRRLLMKARWENSAVKDVSRKNSGNRVMIEARVLGALKTTSRALSSSKLCIEARQVNFELKDNTFRTYLHRMKEKGLIVSAGRGLWELADDTKNPA